MAKMVQFKVTADKKITRHGKLIAAGETISIPEEMAMMYRLFGSVVQDQPAPAPTPEPEHHDN